MKKELIVHLHTSFEELVHMEEEAGVEFWLARDLQKVLGYDRWENFERVIKKAVTACEASGYDASDWNRRRKTRGNRPMRSRSSFERTEICNRCQRGIGGPRSI